MTVPARPSWLLRLLLPPARGDGIARDTAWNAAVNGAAAGLSFFLLLRASRAAGAYWCGVAALGLAVSQQLFTLGNFTMGGYQASDVAERRSFGDYVAAKAVSVCAMLLAGAAWVAWGGLGRDKALCLAALLAYQASDAFSNAFFARYQQRGRLDTACRIRFAKIMAFAIVYAAVLAATRSVPASLAAASAAHIALFFATDVPLLRLFGPLRLRVPGRAAFSILLACLPLAFNSFLLMYVNNGPRFAVDAALGEEALAAFSALFMVSFVVAVCADFLMNPQVVRLAEAVRAGDRSTALRTLLRPLAAIGLLGAAGLAVAATFGAPVLARIFGLDLSPHRDTLCVALVGGVLVALYQLGQTVLVVLRKQAWGLPGMVVAAAVARLAARPFVERLGLRGAALSYVLAVLILAAASDSFAALFLRRTAWRSPQPGTEP